VGTAQALGARLLDNNEGELPPGGASLAGLARVDMTALDVRLRECEIVIAVDVTNPLCGPDGASYVYGPQKGADEDAVRELDAALAHFADVVRRDLAVDAADAPGAGAAGGLGYGLMVFCGANVRAGFAVVADAVDFAQRAARADLIVTGEGRLDRQSGFGKTMAGVARVAREHGKPVVAFVGSIADSDAMKAFDAVFALGSQADESEESMRGARERLERTAEDAGASLAGRGLLR